MLVLLSLGIIMSRSPYRRFIGSMDINYEKWHDGIGYDIEALHQTNISERKEIEKIIVNKNPLDWRDIEVLAILDTPITRSIILRALIGENNEVNMAVLRFAPELISNEVKTRTLVKALKSAKLFDGFSQTLDLVKEYHPDEIVIELFRGLLYREGGIAVHFAAMLFYIYDKADTIFDENYKDFFLKFNTPKLSIRIHFFKELCKTVNVDYRKVFQQIAIKEE